MKREIKEYIRSYEEKVIPLNMGIALAYWNASVSGKQEDYKILSDLQIELSRIYSNREEFEKVKEYSRNPIIKDKTAKRELKLIYNLYLSNQADNKKLEKIIELQNYIEHKFSTYRVEHNGRKITDNEVNDILKSSSDSKEAESVWMTSKNTGREVAEDIRSLVRLRNETARELGFANYHEMSLRLDEQNPAEIDEIFKEIEDYTDNVYKDTKEEIDKFLSSKFGVDRSALMPWHYGDRFFCEAPGIYEINFDDVYKNIDVTGITKRYFDVIGLNIDDIIERSDLYEKQGKNQHGYCISINRSEDIRILCNIKPNKNWMNAMLHESGHAAYYRFIDSSLPYTLREPAHTFTTEAVAMMFGRFATNAGWLRAMGCISEEEKQKINNSCFRTLRLEQLVFSRWNLLMYNFEKALYADPEQDLNSLWWAMAEKYQMLRRPPGRDEPDWATKLHIANMPCYYHNYMLGELLALQIYYYIVTNVMKSDDFINECFVNNIPAGKYLKENIFHPGKKLHWNEMIENATGEKLTVKYWARQFVGTGERVSSF